MKCQVAGCDDEASDVLTYKREGKTDAAGLANFPLTFEIAFCPPHAGGLRALAAAFVNDPQAQPRVGVACSAKGCMDPATVKLTDLTGAPAGFYCEPHATEALAVLNGEVCSLEGCGKPGRLVVESPLGDTAIYGCPKHAPDIEKAARAAGGREVKFPEQRVDGKCFTSGCEREATVHGEHAFAMWCGPCADDIAEYKREREQR